MTSFLRSLTADQQVSLLFVLLFGLSDPGQCHLAGAVHARAPTERGPRAWPGAAAEGLPGPVAHVLAHGAGVLAGLGRRGRRGHGSVRPGLVLCLARVHQPVAHPPRRPSQPAAGLFHRAAIAVPAGLDRALRPLHRLHPGLRLPGHPDRERARQRPSPLSGPQRQAAVGHHGLRLRHEPCARPAAARLPQRPGTIGFLVFFLVAGGADGHAGPAHRVAIPLARPWRQPSAPSFQLARLGRRRAGRWACWAQRWQASPRSSPCPPWPWPWSPRRLAALATW